MEMYDLIKIEKSTNVDYSPQRKVRHGTIRNG